MLCHSSLRGRPASTRAPPARYHTLPWRTCTRCPARTCSAFVHPPPVSPMLAACLGLVPGTTAARGSTGWSSRSHSGSSRTGWHPDPPSCYAAALSSRQGRGVPLSPRRAHRCVPYRRERKIKPPLRVAASPVSVRAARRCRHRERSESCNDSTARGCPTCGGYDALAGDGRQKTWEGEWGVCDENFTAVTVYEQRDDLIHRGSPRFPDVPAISSVLLYGAPFASRTAVPGACSPSHVASNQLATQVAADLQPYRRTPRTRAKRRTLTRRRQRPRSSSRAKKQRKGRRKGSSIEGEICLDCLSLPSPHLLSPFPSPPAAESTGWQRGCRSPQVSACLLVPSASSCPYSARLA